MKIRYKDRRLEKIYSDLNKLNKKIGPIYTKIVKRRLSEIEAADNFAIYLKVGAGSPHLLDFNLKGCYGVSISGNVRLIIKPDIQEFVQEEFMKCIEVEIGGIVDYHGGKENWVIK